MKRGSWHNFHPVEHYETLFSLDIREAKFDNILSWQDTCHPADDGYNMAFFEAEKLLSSFLKPQDYSL